MVLRNTGKYLLYFLKVVNISSLTLEAVPAIYFK